MAPFAGVLPIRPLPKAAKELPLPRIWAPKPRSCSDERLASRTRTSRITSCDARTVMTDVAPSGANLSASSLARLATLAVDTCPVSRTPSPMVWTRMPSPGKATLRSCSSEWES